MKNFNKELMPLDPETSPWVSGLTATIRSLEADKFVYAFIPQMCSDYLEETEYIEKYFTLGKILKSLYPGAMVNPTEFGDEKTIELFNCLRQMPHESYKFQIVLFRPELVEDEPLERRWFIHNLPLTYLNVDDYREKFYNTLWNAIKNHCYDTEIDGNQLSHESLDEWCDVIANYCFSVSQLTNILAEEETQALWREHWKQEFEDSFMACLLDEIKSFLPRAKVT